MPPRNSADSGVLLDGVLNNTQVPHQSLCVINDGTTFSGLPIFKDILRRAIRRGEEVTLISILHSPEDLLPSDTSSSSSAKIKVIDLSGSVQGYSTEEDIGTMKDKILSTYTSGQIFIDALDILAEDYSSSAVLSLTRSILNVIKKSKAPSRLILLLPPSSIIHSALIPPSFNSTITLLTPHQPSLVQHLSKSYLSPISITPSPNLWMILENATKRSISSDLAYKGEEGIEADPNWLTNGGNAIIQVLVRKATGGIKGISRSLEAAKCSTGDIDTRSELEVIELEDIINLNPITNPTNTISPMENGDNKPIQNHSELDLPFNLSLTDDQRRKRAEVPLPYAHEGEGASGDLIWEDEEETDDEEI
ncbi:uncharacterized protein IL334_005205 [Kwoniella shivajii]|uniref:Elongator complex protein 5 n=1 Tax=Kwoniella shivajii TaxID=564305 RepID=A0ABZ1D2H4_9TREE|nr:hypothetical protein IL334_005205 [Kwoniella shivajii]